MLRRSIKNATKNFAPCERDVRDATSNDKSMASVTTMVRISNATYNVTTSPMVMAMMWKRLNDMGKNWRHVYKSLLLLDYLLKTGAEHIVTEVKENKFAIQSLLEFRYIDSRGVDKGINVREQAKLTLRLIENEAGLIQERVKGMQQHARNSEALGTKAQPKNTQASRANKFAERANVMPNGEVAPDLAEQERQAVRNAQVASYNEWGSSAAGQTAAIQAQQYTSTTPAAASTPNGNPADPNRAAGNNNLTEDEALAYALRVSAIESGAEGSNYQQHMGSALAPASAPAPAPAPTMFSHNSAMSPEEEEQLAMALSLSLTEVTAANNVLNSDNESDGEITPPSTPYQGEAFEHRAPSDDSAEGAPGYMTVQPTTASGIAFSDALPTYDDSLAELSPGRADQSMIHSEMSQLSDYVNMHDSFGAPEPDTSPEPAGVPGGYLMVEPPVMPPGMLAPSPPSTQNDDSDEEL